MLQKIHLLFAFALALPSAGFALVGGPFDNGDYSQALDERGIYQATLRFPNGQGFAQFASNVNVSAFRDLALGTNGTGNGINLGTANGSYLNRSILYYKGVTYLGTCYGTVDMVGKSIDAITNGNSDVSTTNTTAAATTVTAAVAISTTTTLIANGTRSFTANTAWSAKITSVQPVLKFVGDGQLTVLSQDGTSQILAILTALQGPIATAATQQQQTTVTINQAGGTITATVASANATVPLTGPGQSSIVGINATSLPFTINNQGVVTSLPANSLTFTGTQAPGLLQNLGLLVNGDPANGIPSLADTFANATPNPDKVRDNSDQVHLKVFGIRKFFLSRQ